MKKQHLLLKCDDKKARENPQSGLPCGFLVAEAGFEPAAFGL